uniref:Protein kinase domain-containing protein n=1 Tax=Acrobeloides nanus TaxID=290746 RepID=A0A914DTD2_9BILA
MFSEIRGTFKVAKDMESAISELVKKSNYSYNSSLSYNRAKIIIEFSIETFIWKEHEEEKPRFKNSYTYAKMCETTIDEVYLEENTQTIFGYFISNDTKHWVSVENPSTLLLEIPDIKQSIGDKIHGVAIRWMDFDYVNGTCEDQTPFVLSRLIICKMPKIPFNGPREICSGLPETIDEKYKDPKKFDGWEFSIFPCLHEKKLNRDQLPDLSYEKVNDISVGTVCNGLFLIGKDSIKYYLNNGHKHELGRGHFGVVYKGCICFPDESILRTRKYNVAIKELRDKDAQHNNENEMCYVYLDAMSYLHSKKIIHGDLSARNVLVHKFSKEVQTVEVADFGLSQIVNGINSSSKNNVVPLCWAALECLLEPNSRLRQLSGKSDNWSFGVTVWEILTFGKYPYYELSLGTKEKLIEYLINGNRLRAPSNCMPDLFAMMIKCWTEDPEIRPEFEVLEEFFLKCLQNPDDFIKWNGVENDLTWDKKRAAVFLDPTTSAGPVPYPNLRTDPEKISLLDPRSRRSSLSLDDSSIRYENIPMSNLDSDPTKSAGAISSTSHVRGQIEAWEKLSKLTNNSQIQHQSNEDSNDGYIVPKFKKDSNDGYIVPKISATVKVISTDSPKNLDMKKECEIDNLSSVTTTKAFIHDYRNEN